MAPNPSNIAAASALALALTACGADEIVMLGDAAMGGSAGIGGVSNAEAPEIPIGFDAYRRWTELPTIRIGERAYMRSTYDRTGGNHAADASHFLRQDAEDRNVTVDAEGPGILYFVRTNHWHGSPWHYLIDGVDHVVEESSTADPSNPVAGSVFLPTDVFPTPLTYTWSTTRGADLNWAPMPFEHAFELAYARTHYGTGYYIYHQFPEGASNLSAPLSTFSEQAPPADVIELLGRAGDDIAPNDGGTNSISNSFVVVPGEATTLVDLTDGPRVIRAIVLDVPKDRAIAVSRARLRISWDGLSEPSVDAPLALFFGTGSLYNRTGSEWLVRGLFVGVHFGATDVTLQTFFPMPYFTRARVEIVGDAEAVSGARFRIRTEPYSAPRNSTGFFHATYRDHANPVAGEDLVILDTKSAEGGDGSAEFCGSFVGMSWIFSDRAVFDTLEGDPRFFFDDSSSPQAYGTGTEEWGGGGDYWGGQTMTLPLVGHPVGAPSAALALDAEDQIESAYRLLLADQMPFGKNAKIQLEHGGTDESTEHYQSVAYWYGVPGACLVQTDELDVGDLTSEKAHAYASPDASDVEIVSSRYEWGVDTLGTTVIYPETADGGRHTTGTSEFTLTIRPDNLGVLLRRKLDYAFADQRAEVLIADDVAGAEYEPAGIWYLAGSNTCVYSNPADELGAAEHLVETSNRRWRDDEFLVPPALTRGRDKIRVRIVFEPKPKPLYAGYPLADLAWSEYRYWAYSYVLPAAQ